MILLEKNFKIVEDAAHSPGSYEKNLNGNYVRSGDCQFSDASCTSFHPVKHICCGEGGAILTNDEQIAKNASLLRSHSIVRPFDENHATPWYYEQDELGWNYRLTDLQAALGRSQLASLDEQLVKRRKLALRYHQLLKAPHTVISYLPHSRMKRHAWHLYIIQFFDTGMRDKAHRYLKRKME